MSKYIHCKMWGSNTLGKPVAWKLGGSITNKRQCGDKMITANTIKYNLNENRVSNFEYILHETGYNIYNTWQNKTEQKYIIWLFV